MPAIVLYLGETLDLLPATPALRALTMKIVNDANDVIDEIDLDGGHGCGPTARWKKFIPRVKKWMTIWEETGKRHGLAADSGFHAGRKAGGYRRCDPRRRSGRQWPTASAKSTRCSPRRRR